MASLSLPGPLVDVHWLAENLDHPRLRLLDATFLPPSGPPPGTAPENQRIPGAGMFDFDQRICDLDNPLPHMMPSPETFAREARSLGINRDSLIVVYDRVGLFSSPRGWWMFRAMGHDNVAVLDGGMPAWIAAGHDTAPWDNRTPEPGNFEADARPHLFYNADQVAAALNDPRHQVLDARSEGRFSGREPEPRPGLRSGHMPGAGNLPFSQVQESGRMLPAEALADIFRTWTEGDRRLVFSCGSGVSACVLALAAELAGHDSIAVYDGSWSEWGQPSARPVVSDDR
jgi:thiosulfate/3-mercaptopyruvate sulfurtransferase